MRDIGPRHDRSIRNIPVPASHRRAPHEQEAHEEEVGEPSRSRRGRRMGGWFLWAVVTVVVAGTLGGILLSTLFAGATITVSLRTASVTPPATIIAQTNPSAGALAYQVVSTSRTASTTVPATGTEQVSRAASGVITIYNDYSTASQRLIANTRFEAPNGQIYRIHESVVVPGATKNADGALTPGTVSLTAYADSPGDSYDCGATQFTIPGFKNDPRYTTFYAKTDAMTDGFVGTEAAIAPADLAKAKTLLQQGLAGALNTAASTGIPAEYLSIPGTLQISYGNVSETTNADGTATLAESASATADIVRADDLAAAIARQVVQGYNGEAVGFVDSSAITIALASSSSASGPLQLELSGSSTLQWQFDPDTLKAALVGKPKGQFETVIASFAPAIACTTDTPCKASIRPFWSSTFPTNPDKITIKVAGS